MIGCLFSAEEYCMHDLCWVIMIDDLEYDVDKPKIGKCKECGRKKELTCHGTCWPCHLGKVFFNTRIEARKK